MSRILVIDDDKDWLVFVRRLLESAGHSVKLLIGANKLIETMRADTPDLVITDIMMPGIAGSGVHGLIRTQFGPELPILVCSSTKLTLKQSDPKLLHCPKGEASEELLPTVTLMLESSELDYSSIHPSESLSQKETS